jgi:TolA-binding protein
MLAQLQSVDGNLLRDVIIIFIVLGSFAILLYSTFRRRSIEPTPFPVELTGPIKTQDHDVSVTNEHCKGIHKALDHRVTRIESDLNEFNSEIKKMRSEFNALLLQENSKIHCRINEILVAVSKIQGFIEKDR